VVEVSSAVSHGATGRELGNNVSSSEVPAPRLVTDIVDYIHLKESSRGKNNYSKCAEIGLYNEFGYGIPGNGEFMCFEKGLDRAEVERWVQDKLDEKYTVPELLCLYNTGTAYQTCNYSKIYEKNLSSK
jgi:hypothetical protein